MSMNKRQYSILDQVLIQLDRGLNTVCAIPQSQRPNPTENMDEPILSEEQRKRSSHMMRVNHTGEICAQALYFGQMAMANKSAVYEVLAKAADEETDHLSWTAQRLKELASHRSYLNPIWYSQAYCIGLVAGLCGDNWSLGFIEETERQVTAHLDNHLGLLPLADTKSRQIVKQMRDDEYHHGQAAGQAGAKPLPWIIKRLMSYQAKVMTTIAAWI